MVIVDDHAPFRSEARSLLEEEGYDVVGEAADGRSALAVVRETKPDLVLLDVQLPDLDGFEVASRLAEDLPETGVVMISSRDASDYRAHLAASSALGFIPKAELSRDALIAAVRRVG